MRIQKGFWKPGNEYLCGIPRNYRLSKKVIKGLCRLNKNCLIYLYLLFTNQLTSEN